MRFYTRKILLISFTLIILFTYNCQIPYEFENPEPESRIPVVEGVLTNTDGPHFVKMRYARPYNTNSFKEITGAEVWINDDKGNRVLVNEGEMGEYIIEKGLFKPDIGATYSLEINLPDGRLIRSTPSIMPDTIPVNNVYLREIDIAEPPAWTHDGSRPHPGLTVCMDISDNIAKKSFYRISGSQLVIQQNEIIRTYPIPSLAEVIYYDAEIIAWRYIGFVDCCFTLRREVNHHRIGQIDPIIKYPADQLSIPVIRLSPTLNLSEIPEVGWNNYINLYGISPEAFSYYNSQLRQLDAPDRIFDPVPAQLLGNLYFEDEPTKPVLGFFDVCSVSQREYMVSIETGFQSSRVLLSQAKSKLIPMDSYKYIPGCHTFLIDTIIPVGDTLNIDFFSDEFMPSLISN